MDYRDIEHALSELRRMTSDDFIDDSLNGLNESDGVKIALAYGAICAHFNALDTWLETGGILPESWHFINDGSETKLSRDSKEYKDRYETYPED